MFLEVVVCFTEFMCEVVFLPVMIWTLAFVLLAVIEKNTLELFSVCFRFYTVQMAPKKRPHANSSSSHSHFETTRFPMINRAIHFQNLFIKRSVESEREVADDFLINLFVTA